MEQHIAKNKQNNKALGIIYKIVLYIAMVFSVIGTTEAMFNTIPFTDFVGLSMELPENFYSVLRFTMPLFMGLIYYGVYTIFISMVSSSINNRMRAFNLMVLKNKIRQLIDPCFIVLCIAIGLIDILFYIYPFWSNMLENPTRILLGFMTIVWIYKRFTNELEDIFKPLILRALVWPGIIMVVLL